MMSESCVMNPCDMHGAACYMHVTTGFAYMIMMRYSTGFDHMTDNWSRYDRWNYAVVVVFTIMAVTLH